MNIHIFDSTIEIDDSVIDASPAAIQSQLREYERGERRRFDLAVTVPEGMAGQVMTALRDIPYGETRTYGDIAERLDTAPVVVGQACARNPVPLVVPCHRVVGSSGDLRGYSAAGGVATKRRLLSFEASEPVQTKLVSD